MPDMYTVRFIRSDELPAEEYSYSNRKEALAHYSAYLNSNNEIYFAVQLICTNEHTSHIETEALLGLSETEKGYIREVGCNEQLETCLQLKNLISKLNDDTDKHDAVTARIKIENLSFHKYPIFFEMLNSKP